MEFGPYRIVRRLASGGMGEVFLATLERDGGFQKEVAVKSVHPKYMADSRFIEFFEREARLAALLNHRHIVQIFDFGRDDNRVWLAMEYVDGVDLKTVMNCLKGPLPLRICLDVVQAVARALHYAHRATDSRGKRLEIVHRDISPQNILLSFEGDVKVADFGLAHAAALGPDKDRSLKGKYAYMSPEQVQGTPIDARTDQFSLGIVLYEILTGKRAFHDADGVSATLEKVQAGEPGLGFSDLRERVPSAVAEIVERALDVNRMKRFPDLGHFVDALRAANNELGASVPSMDLSEWLRQLFPDRRVISAATTVEATRTALAEEPIVVRPEVPAPANMSTGELKEFGDATTGSHRSQVIENYVNKQAETKSEGKGSWVSPLLGRGSIGIVLVSAVLTSFALSYISIPGSSEPPDSASVPAQAPAVIDSTGTEQVDNQPVVLASSDAESNDVKTDSSVQIQDMSLQEDVAASPLKKTSLQKDVATSPLKKTSLQKDVAVSPLKKTSSTSAGSKTSTRKAVSANQKDVESSGSPKTSRRSNLETDRIVEEVSVRADVVSKRPDAGSVEPRLDSSVADEIGAVAEDSPNGKNTQAEPLSEVSSITIKVPGSVVNTKARSLAPDTYALSDRGDLFKLTVGDVKLFLRLSAPRGRFLLSANSNPWASIVVDGRKLGGTPLAAFPLTPGRHKLLFSTAKGKQVALSFNLVR